MGSWSDGLLGALYGVGQATLESYGQQMNQQPSSSNQYSTYALGQNDWYTSVPTSTFRVEWDANGHMRIVHGRRPLPPQPHSNFGVHIQKERALLESFAEDENMREGFTGMLNTFMVGCDPEFVALDSQGRGINLSPLLRAEGEIGFDHNGRVGELRPEPTKGTYALVKKLQRLIKSEAMGRINASKLRAGARVNQDTLGGHVHLGFPVSNIKDKVAALDRVTQVLEALDILPSTECKSRRDRGSYGHFGDVRDSRGHMEYRTMASWLTDPKVAYLCLTGAKLAACDPDGTIKNLPTTASFNALIEWFRNYRTKDINARRALERVLSLGHKPLQVYPDVDFRERWRELGL